MEAMKRSLFVAQISRIIVHYRLGNFNHNDLLRICKMDSDSSVLQARKKTNVIGFDNTFAQKEKKVEKKEF